MALRARGDAELSELLSDLLSRAGPGSWLVRAVGWWSAWVASVRQAWQTPRLPRLVLPRLVLPHDEWVYLIGRAPECDFTVRDMTVSWRHAELRLSAGHWVLVDLGSKNGTHVNGYVLGARLAAAGVRRPSRSYSSTPT